MSKRLFIIFFSLVKPGLRTIFREFREKVFVDGYMNVFLFLIHFENLNSFSFSIIFESLRLSYCKWFMPSFKKYNKLWDKTCMAS